MAPSKNKGTKVIEIAEDEEVYEFESSSIKVKVPELTDVNWTQWKRRIQLRLRSQKLLDAIQKDPTKQDRNSELFQERDERASIVILDSLSQEVADKIVDDGSAWDLWQQLLAINEGAGSNLLSNLLGRLMTANERYADVATFGAEISQISEQLQGMNADMRMLGRYLFVRGLPDDFKPIKPWLHSKADEGLKSLISIATEHERESGLCENQANRQKTNALSASTNNKPYQKDSDQSRFLYKCSYCNIPGHKRADCRKRLADQRKNGEDASEQPHAGSKSDEPEREKAHANSASTSTCVESWRIHALTAKTSAGPDEDGWLGDSGAGGHMSGRREWFLQLEPLRNRQVEIILGDDSKLAAVATGIIRVTNKFGQQFDLHNSLYVPGMKRNLLALGEIAKKGYGIWMIDEELSIVENRNGKVLLTGVYAGRGLYKMQMSTVISIPAYHAHTSRATAASWHQRLGHINYGKLKQMLRSDAVTGISCTDKVTGEEQCEPCVYGKMSRKPFKPSSSREQTPGALVHFDTVGKFQVESFGRAQYLVIFTDDCTGYVIVRPLRNKSDAGEAVKNVYAFIRSSGHDLRKMRTDNAREFISQEMESVLNEFKVTLETVAAYCPEQNGRAERQNRTIIEMARTIRIAADLPEGLWAEMAETAAYIRNRVPLDRIGGKTPYEAWTGRKPDVEHLRIIGSTALAYIPGVYRKKLDPKAERLVLVGYEAGCKSYRLWKRGTKQVQVVRDVQIFEQKVQGLGTPEKDGQASGEDPGVKTQEAVSTRVITRSASRARLESEGDDANDQVLNALLSQTLDKPQDDVVPQSIAEASKSVDADLWMQAAEEEMRSLRTSGTWKLTELPKGNHKPLKCRWIFKRKPMPGQAPDRLKARLVVKGCAQRPGVDFGETFAPVARFETIRLVLAYASTQPCDLIQFDINTAFLNGDLEGEVLFMQQPEGFDDRSGRVCQLQKSLYGLKQAPRAWNRTFSRFLEDFGLRQASSDSCLYVGRDLLVVLYVDDGLVVSRSLGAAENLLHSMRSKFEATSGACDQYLGIQIEFDKMDKSVCIHQRAYVDRLLAKFAMVECNPSDTPAEPKQDMLRNTGAQAMVPYRNLLGGLMYLATATRPDISFIVGRLCQHLENPSEMHWQAAKRVLRYLKGTPQLGLRYSGSTEQMNKLCVYTDADFAMCADTRKSTTGVVAMLNGAPAVWFSRKQTFVADSTTVAEYAALFDGAKEAIWCRRLLEEIGAKQQQPTPVFIDNASALKLVLNPVFHQRTKHVDIKLHFTREVEASGRINCTHVSTHEQLADLLTKPMPRISFERMRKKLGMA